MSDIYCDQILSKKIKVKTVIETENILAFHHTKPYWPVHIVVIPKKHIESLLKLKNRDNQIFLELFDVIKQMASQVTDKHGSCRVLTNSGEYQDSKHLHFHISFGKPNQTVASLEFLQGLSLQNPSKTRSTSKLSPNLSCD